MVNRHKGVRLSSLVERVLDKAEYQEQYTEAQDKALAKIRAAKAKEPLVPQFPPMEMVASDPVYTEYKGGVGTGKPAVVKPALDMKGGKVWIA